MSTAYPSAMHNMLPTAVPKYQDIATRLGYYLLVLIACLSPWGKVFRLEGAGERGATTIFAVGVILISALSVKFFAAIVTRPRVLLFAAFVLIGTFASMLQDLPVISSLMIGGIRGIYWVLMVAVMSFNLDSEKGRSVVRIFAVSAALMSLVSLIDYFHIMDVPLFNEGYTSFTLDKGKVSSLVGRSLVGPFENRSVLGPYLALAWSVPLMELIHGKLKNPVKISFWIGILAVLSLAIFVCYSRALYLTVAFCGLYALYTSGYQKAFKIAFLVIPLLVVFFVAAQNMFPHEMEVLTHRLESLTPEKIFKSGGQIRTGMLKATIDDLINNPQGMGFGLVEFAQRRLEVHSIYIEHLRPAGFLGFLLVCIFVWPVIKLMKSRKAATGVFVMCSSLIGVLAYGIGHSAHSMLMLWIIIGILYGLSNKPEELQAGAVNMKRVYR